MSAVWLLTLLGWGTAVVLLVEQARRAGRVARACHEVRGPLTAAGLALHAAARRGPEVLPAIEAELSRAAAAVEDLFAAGAAPPVPVDVVALVRELRPGWDGVAVRLPAAPVLIEGDPVRLARAVGNLVANAVRHGVPPVEVEVRRAGARVLVDVRDDGPGLPEPVERLASRRSRGRHGHGLSVARDAARQHGGTLRSGPGPGTCLRLDLPAVPGAMTAPGALIAPEADATTAPGALVAEEDAA